LSDAFSFRTYIPEPKRLHDRTWTDKPADYERCVRNNRRRLQRAKSKRFQRLRSERCERTFAHICDTGGMRRSWLRGLLDVSKRYTIAAAAHNLGRILRSLFGIGKPRALQGQDGTFALTQLLTERVLKPFAALLSPPLLNPPARWLAARGISRRQETSLLQRAVNGSILPRVKILCFAATIARVDNFRAKSARIRYNARVSLCLDFTRKQRP
jgi:Transposase DDE domain